MKISFVATLPKKDSARLLMDLPESICKKIDNKSFQKVNVTINDRKYLCNLFQKNNIYSLHIITAIKKDFGLGKTLSFVIENIIENVTENNDMHKTVLDWELNECKKLMEKIGIKKGYIIIDFACGYGHYTIPCALALNKSGKVYAIDKDKKPLEWINKKCEMFKLNNIETIKTSGLWKIDFPDNSADIILLYDVIHAKDIQTKKFIRFTLYQESQRVLKKGGILSVLTFDSEIKKISSKNIKNKSQEIYQDMINEIIEMGFNFSHIINNAIHFDYYHSNYHMNKGIEFLELEKGNIYNFKKL